MWQRVQVFAFALSGNFEKCVRQELAQRDLMVECHRPGVLIARGLLGPAILAVCRAARLALGEESGRAQSARALFRAASDDRETCVRSKPLKIPIAGHALNERIPA